jgi:predicted ATP-grasp superfamily ATP-dependent carboligase
MVQELIPVEGNASSALCKDGEVLASLIARRHPRSGEYKLLDIKAKIWGWQTLCARAGVISPFLVAFSYATEQ